MAITFTLNDEAVNDQTTGLQTGDNSDDPFTDTDVAYSSLPASFRTYLESTLGLSSVFPTAVGVGRMTNSVTVNSTGTLGSIIFTDGNGGTLDGDPSGLKTVDGKDIWLWAGANNTVIGRYDLDGDGIKEADDAIAFVIQAEVVSIGATSAKVNFNVVTYVPIRHPDATNPDDAVDLGDFLKLAASETVSFGFAGAPSGSNLFMTFGNPNSTQIVVIGQDPLNQSQGGNISTKDVLNISQAGSTTSFGVNGNQINPDEGAFITYVSGANTNFLVPNLDQNEADVEANIQFQNVVNATTASFTVNQTNPGVGPVTVKISAFTTAAETGVNFVDGLTNDTHVAITSFSLTDVVVKTGNTQFTPSATIDADGNLIVTGLSTGDTVQWTTSGTHNRVLIENISNADGVTGNDNNTFDIGGFGIATSSGDSISVGRQIVIEDDGNSIVVDDASGTYAAGATGTWDHDNGTDGSSLGVTLDGYTLGGNAGTGTVLFTQTGDFAFEGSIEDDFNGDGTDETVPFTLIFDPDLDTYVLNVTTPPPTETIQDTSQGSLKAGGPDAVQTLEFPPTGHDKDIVFFAVNPIAPTQSGNPPSAPPPTTSRTLSSTIRPRRRSRGTMLRA